MAVLKNLTLIALVIGAALASPAPQDDSITPCSSVRCAAGTKCQVQYGSAHCVATAPILPARDECGGILCPEGTTCCNPLCQMCVPPGFMCTMGSCGSPATLEPVAPRQIEEGEQCGETTCPEGQYCCNWSCGYCRDPGDGCTKEFCGPDETIIEPIQEDEGEQCGGNTCYGDQYCCNPSCGYCRDPSDGCTREFCDPDESVFKERSVEKREVCGPTVCPDGQYCCNPSCGYCSDPGDGCTEEFCDPDEIFGWLGKLDNDYE